MQSIYSPIPSQTRDAIPNPGESIDSYETQSTYGFNSTFLLKTVTRSYPNNYIYSVSELFANFIAQSCADGDLWNERQQNCDSY